MNAHQIKGRVSQATGKVKQLTGKLFGNRWLETKGRAQKAGGKMRTGYGDTTDDLQKRG